MNLLRDSAQLQTQLRLFENLVDTRYTILKLRPNLRQNWVALAVAYHLSGNLLEAKKILEHYQRSLKVCLSRLTYAHDANTKLRTYPITILNTRKRSFTTFLFWRRSESCQKHFQFWIQAQGREPSLIVLLFLKLEVCFLGFHKKAYS